MKRDDLWVVVGASIPFLIGAAIFGLGVRNLVRAYASPSWPKAQGVVATSDTSATSTSDRRTGASDTMYSANIRFRYQVNGRDYTTDTLHFGQTVGSGDSSDAELAKLRYPVGAKVPVSYDPRRPEVAAVYPGFDADLLFLPGAGLAFGVPAVMCIILYFGMSRGNSLFGLGLGIFAAIFATLGVLFLSIGAIRLWRAQESESWPRAPGVIVYGKIDSSTTVSETADHERVRSSASGARLIYSYEVNGDKHYSNIRRFGQLAGASGDWASEIAARYPLGKTVAVFYSPAEPDLATLEAGIGSEALWLPGAGAAFLLFGLAVFVWGIPALTRSL